LRTVFSRVGFRATTPRGDQPVRRAQPFDEVEVAEDVRAAFDRSLGFVATGEQTDDGHRTPVNKRKPRRKCRGAQTRAN
jgi:hypothetical protein